MNTNPTHSVTLIPSILCVRVSVVMFNEMNLQFENISLDLHNENNKLEEYIITTEYEEKFMGLNQIIYYVKVRL